MGVCLGVEEAFLRPETGLGGNNCRVDFTRLLRSGVITTTAGVLPWLWKFKDEDLMFDENAWIMKMGLPVVISFCLFS